MKFFIIFFLCSYMSFSQDYNPKRYYNPENNIETKQKENNKLRKLFNSILFTRGKKDKDCNCPDQKSNYRTNKLNLANTLSQGLSDLFRCKKEFGNLAMHVHFSDGVLETSPFDSGDLDIGMQWFQGNISYDLWLSAPILNDIEQRYGLRGGMSFFPMGQGGVFRPYLGTSFGLEVDYLYEFVYESGQYIDNWHTELYPLARLHAGIQYMFRCRIISKFDISYAAGSYIDKERNQFPHYRPWVIWQTIGFRF